MTSRYPPIGDYALLADSFSSALISREGSVDWACLRRFDSSSCFGRLLDWDHGGCFVVAPRHATDITRRYVDGTLVLETTVTVDGGAQVRLLDALVARPGGREDPPHELVRIIEGIRGEVDVDVHIEPRFDYGSLRPWLSRHGEEAYSAVGGDDALVITSGAELEVDRQHTRLAGRARVGAGQRVRLCAASQLPHELDPLPLSHDAIDHRLDETIRWWQRWSAGTRASGPYADHIRHSAAVLRGLTCAPTGAIVAAATTSLPEVPDGSKNWDYRYSWVRDSTLTLDALSAVGHEEVARGFRDFLMRSSAGHVDDLQIMFGCYGERRLTEVELDLEGYRGARPVRVGNDAVGQRQLGVYGHILEAAQHWIGDEVGDDDWAFLRGTVEAAADSLDAPGHGIWELRGEPQHFVHSKVLLWVALDRGIALAERTGRDADLDRWREARQRIRERVLSQGVAEGGHFVQTFGSDEADASLLRLPALGFIDARDERMVATVEVIQQRLGTEPHGFLRRFESDPDEAATPAAFVLCTFWLVDVLCLQGRRDEAVALFERLLATANDVGLLSEMVEADTGQLLGNFPQAFSHMALINSACRLSEAAPQG